MTDRAQIEFDLAIDEALKGVPPPGVTHRLLEKIEERKEKKKTTALREIMRALDKMIDCLEAEAVIEYRGKLLHVQTIDDFRPYLKISEL